MIHFLKISILVAAPLLMAALWMDNQPSYKAYEAPVLAAPAGSVPVSGKETAEQQSRMPIPPASTAETLAQGKKLFEINCAMCHGQTTAKPGPVGAKLKPSPPGLNQELLNQRSDSHLFNAITLGFGRMPPFRDRLSPQERRDLIQFLRTRN